VVVTAANVQDRDGAMTLLAFLQYQFTRLRCIWADGAYAGDLIAWVRDVRSYRKIGLEIVKRSDQIKGFVVLPKRWIVERTFGWFGRYKRLSKDYEYLTETSEAMIHGVMIHIMIRRLAQKLSF